MYIKTRISDSQIDMKRLDRSLRLFELGNVLMLSEGRPGIDDKYSLSDGIGLPQPNLLLYAEICLGVLRLDLAKENYERCGLVGKPIHDGGRKHMKSRYCGECGSLHSSMD